MNCRKVQKLHCVYKNTSHTIYGEKYSSKGNDTWEKIILNATLYYMGLFTPQSVTREWIGKVTYKGNIKRKQQIQFVC